MIPCHICGIDAGANWTLGFPTAPDSQKVALCKEHNVLENRALASEEWNKRILGNIAANTEVEAFKSGAKLNLLTINFFGGGTIAIPCLSFNLAENDILEVITPDGTAFFPLRHIKHYAITSENHIKQPEK